MEFRIVDCRCFHEVDEVDGEEEVSSERFMVQLYGIDEERNTYAVTIAGFKPCFYVKIPDSFNVDKRKAFAEHLREKLGRFFQSSLVEYGLINRAKL